MELRLRSINEQRKVAIVLVAVAEKQMLSCFDFEPLIYETSRDDDLSRAVDFHTEVRRVSGLTHLKSRSAEVDVELTLW